MDYESLMRSMEASAEEKRKEILEKARREAATIMEEALVKAEAIERSHLINASLRVERERNRSLYLARNDVKKDVAGIKHELFSRSFLEAEKRLAGMRDHDDYGIRFKKLALEALSTLGDHEAVLQIDPRDEEVCINTLSSLGHDYHIKPGLKSIGGLNVSTPDERVIVFNTIESRLKTARERMKTEIFSTLFGD